ncbi:hypothetical protein EC968_009203 [Mortierella alpina]|nr:hypothetical protein EC968_009203 [Mortierella alpina]
MIHHFVSERLLRPFRQTSSPSSFTENAHLFSSARENAVTQEQASAADRVPTVATCFDRPQELGVIMSPLINYSVEPVNGSLMEVDQECLPHNPARTTRYHLPRLFDVTTGNRKTDKHFRKLCEDNQRLENQLRYVLSQNQEKEAHCLELFSDKQRLESQLGCTLVRNQEMEEHCRTLFHNNQRLERHMKCALAQNQDSMVELERLQDTYSDLSRQNDDLKRKYTKKVESYKELDRNYMDLVRPLHVTVDNYSTICSRLVHIKVSVENLIQKAKGVGSANLKKEVVIEHLRDSNVLENFPVEESLLEPYHLNLCMESAIMTELIHRFFNRPLGYIFDHDEEFEKIRRWVDSRDTKIAARWRQQLCVLVSQDSDAMEFRRERKINEAVMVLMSLVSRVYPNVDMSVKIRELCCNSFDLSFAMFGMEAIIQPVSTPLGTPFDDTTMMTPQKSNPTGTVSLVIFPAFEDKIAFNMKPKVWCA